MLIRHTASSYTFLGIKCSHVIPSTCSAEKSLIKLQAAAKQAFLTSASVRDGLRLLGILIWISRIALVDLARYYTPFKFFRRRAASLANLDGPLELWACARIPLQEWIERCGSNTPRQVDIARPSRLHLWSDASMSGFGVVLISDSTISVLAGHWSAFFPAPHDIHINQLEIDALIIGISWLLTREGPYGERVELFVDNSSVVAAVNKGYSGSFQLNENVRIVRSLLHGWSWGLYWINSLSNIADYPSRLLTSSQDPIHYDIPLRDIFSSEGLL
jgi:hypothetical protein